MVVKKIIWFSLFLALFLHAKEPSVFEAGDLNAPHPYGLTKDEKFILQNRRSIEALQKRVYKLEERVNGLEEKIDGIKSVVEGIDQNVAQLKKRLGQNSEQKLQQEILALKNDLNSSIAVQKSNFDNIKKILKELTSMVDQINASYVSKEDLKEKLASLQTKMKRSSLHAKSGAQLYKEARSAYRKHQYKRAKELFLAAIEKRYKPATSSFYIGESCYYTKDYGCAVRYYKKSASLYANSSFMPTLLLHTAISLERLKQKREAKKFYENLIKLYPKTKAAAIAKSRVRKLK